MSSAVHAELVGSNGDVTDRIWRSTPAEAAGLAAVIMIGAARLVYEEFYRALGTTVDEVGINTWRMMTTSAAGLLAFAPCAWLATLAGVFTANRILPRVERALIGLVVGAVVLMGLIAALGAYARSIVLPLAVAAGVALVALTVLQDRRDHHVLLRQTFRWFAVVAVFAMLLLWASAWAQAQSSARHLRADGTRPEGATVVLDVAIRPVCVQLLGGSTSLVATDRPLLLLGSGPNEIVLRDVIEDRTVAVPHGSAVLGNATGPSSKPRC